MPMYLFGEETTDYDTFPSFHNEWKWNDRECGDISSLNRLVKVVVDMLSQQPINEVIFDLDRMIRFWDLVKNDEIILLGPFQLWFYDSSRVPTHDKSYYLFCINVKVLTKDGTRFRRAGIYYNSDVPEKVFDLLKPYVYSKPEGNPSESFLDVAVHVADIEILWEQRTDNKVKFNILNVKEYG
jgi:hypothetical protein